jgi:hypothetical protein
LAGPKNLKVFDVFASSSPHGGYTGHFTISINDPNILELSDGMHKRDLERYDEFVMVRSSDNRSFVANDLLMVRIDM